MTDTTTHATLTLNRVYDASPARVFAAWADPDARQRWGAPNDGQEVAYLESDFRVGGRDLSHCGPKGNLCFAVEARYADIVEDHRIVFVETVSHDRRRLSVALATMELSAEGAGTRLVLTTQIAAFDDADMIAGYRSGWSAALENLGAELTRLSISA